MTKRIVVYAVLISVMMFCGRAGSPVNEAAEMSEGRVPGSSGEAMKFRKIRYIDKDGTGMEAFSLLIPADWRFEGGITWMLDVPMLPAKAAFRASDPNSRAAFVTYPSHCFYWLQDPVNSGLFPPGSRYFGMEVRHPVTAVDALTRLVLPQEHGKVEIIKAEPLPELVKLVGAGSQGYADGAKVRFRFYDGATLVEEELYGVVEVLYIPVQSMYGQSTNYLWYVEYLFGFQAEPGKLETHTKIFQTISSSFQINPQWYAKYSHLIEYLAQNEIEHIHSLGELSRTLNRMSSQMREENLQQFEERGRIYDQGAQNFSDYMLNIDRYYDPFEGREVELPSGYNHAWSNNLGEYMLTDDPNFNPGVGSNLHWENLKRSGH